MAVTPKSMVHGLAVLTTLASAVALQPTLTQSPCAVHRFRPPVMLAQREARLHEIARKAILKHEFEDAIQCYGLAMERPEWQSPRTFLLAALLHSRLGHPEQARAAFAEGVLHHRNDAKLMQAWGLFESKQGELRRAVRLLKRAVTLDSSLHKVLEWRMFREYNAEVERSQAASGVRRASAVSMSASRVSETRMENKESSQRSTSTPAPALAVERPAIVYTVPMSNRGWRGRPEAGEDPSRWYDAEGERNGPPPNYWRQSMDERAHRRSMAAIDELLAGDMPEESGLRALEQRMPLRAPLENRKLLGRWAAAVRDGAAVASLATPGNTSSALNVPAMVEIRREGDRRTVEHRYGTMDIHLEPGETLKVQLFVGSAESDAEAVTVGAGRLLAGRGICEADSLRPSADMEEPWGALLSRLGGEAAVPVRGRVTFLNDYMMVSRDEESGRLLDVFMRLG